MIACMARTNAQIAAFEANTIKCEQAIALVYEGQLISHVLEMLGMSAQVFHETIARTPELTDSYRRAKAAYAEQVANEVIHIADTEEDAQKARNRIQARQWFASKVSPRDWGDRMDINVTQTIDIGSALMDARARALRPVCDQRDERESQVVDYVDVSPTGPADEQSNAPLPAPSPTRSSLTSRANQAAPIAPAPAKRGRKPKGAP